MIERARLLIVDDEPHNRKLLVRIFRDFCDIVEADNGQTALEWLAHEPFDVVLLDIMMPGMSGLEVLERTRETYPLSELPIILISSLTENEEVAHGITMGANDYISKPINVDIVEARVRTQITLKRYTDERRRMIDYLQSANDLKARLMRVAAHDLKNPLLNIRLAQSMQRTAGRDYDKIQRIMNITDESATAMQRIIDDFLEMHGFSEEGARLRLVPVNLAEIAQQVIYQYAATAHHKRIELLMGDVEGIVVADVNRLLQSLSNLVSNAIKYSPPDRMVTLNSVRQPNGYWRLQVLDEGPGIPAEERATLFDAFKRGSNRPTGGESSTGLGLWIVREMVKLQGGTGGVECPPQGGSHFWVELPAAQVAGV